MADYGNIGYQLGQIATGLNNVQEAQKDRAAAADKFSAHVEGQIADIKREQERAREFMSTTSHTIGNIRDDLADLKKPVEELMTMRNRLGGLVLAFGVIFSALGVVISAILHLFGNPLTWFGGK